MGIKTKIANELKAIFWTSLYFFAWFGALMTVKVLLLHEYKIDFTGASIVIVATLVAAKAVLILENVPLGKNKNRPAITEVLLKTLLFLVGIFLILILEKSIEMRHEYGDFLNSLKNLFDSADGYHILVNTLCIFGSLLFFNLWSVLKKHTGMESIGKILFSPVPEEDNTNKTNNPD